MLWWTLRQLKSKDWKKRALAAEKVGAARHAPAVGTLVELLGDNDYQVRETAARALVNIGPPCVEPLLPLLKGRGGDKQKLAVEVLGEVGDRRAAGPLLEVLQLPRGSVDNDVFFGALRALGKIGDDRAIDPLIQLVTKGGSIGLLNVRTAATEALASGKFKDPRVTDCLLKVIRDYKDETRSLYRIAVEGLGRMGDASCAPALTDLIRKDLSMWEAGTDALASFGDASLAPLVSALKDDDQTKRYLAAKGLRKMRRAGAYEHLMSALSDTYDDVKIEGLLGLGGLRDRRALEPLISHLKASNSRVREAAARALGELGDKDGAYAALMDVVKNTQENRDVRQAAADAVKQLGGGLIVIH